MRKKTDLGTLLVGLLSKLGMMFDFSASLKGKKQDILDAYIFLSLGVYSVLFYLSYSYLNQFIF